MRKTTSFVAAFSFGMSGCASTPDVLATHYLPQGSLTLRAIRTVGCATSDRGAKELFVATSVTATPTYSRDSTASDTIGFHALDSNLSNTSLTLTYYDDGRLKGVNSTSAGVGQEVLQSVVKLASIVLGGGLGYFVAGPGGRRDICDLINEQQSKDKLLTITYALSEPFLATGGFKDAAYVRRDVFLPEPTNPSFLFEIAKALPKLCAAIGPALRVSPPAALREAPVALPTNAPDQDDVSGLTLRQPAQVPVKVVEANDKLTGAAVAGHESVSECGTKWAEVWNGAVLIPQIGYRYHLPIPRAAAFGKTAFELAVAESGVVTSVKYGKDSGAPAVLAALANAADTAQPSTAAEKAAEAKAESDLIYQQRRLLQCQMDASECEK